MFTAAPWLGKTQSAACIVEFDMFKSIASELLATSELLAAVGVFINKQATIKRRQTCHFMREFAESFATF